MKNCTIKLCKIKFIICILIVFMFCFFVSCSEVESTRDEIRSPVDSKSVLGRNYEDVKLQFESAGFANVSLREIYVDEKEIDKKNGSVESIYVDGLSDFRVGRWFDRNADIIISYYKIDINTKTDATEAETTNSFDYKGLLFTIPEYYSQISNEVDERISFVDSNNDDFSSVLTFFQVDNYIPDDTFLESKYAIMDLVLDNIDEDAEATSIQAIELLSYKCLKIEFLTFYEDNLYDGEMYIINHLDNKKITVVSCVNNDNTKYIKNFESMVENMKLYDSSLEEKPQLSYYNYSQDPYANKFITHYNFYSDYDITEEMVEYSNKAVSNTTIVIEGMTVIISEMDGSPSYKVLFESDYNQSNTDLFFEMTKQCIKSTYPILSEDNIQSDIVNELKDYSDSKKIISDYYINDIKHTFSYERNNGVYSIRWGYQSW